MKNVKAKETGDTFWDDETRNPRVTSASLIVPKEIVRELFHPDGRISDKRLETIQYKCFCHFHPAKLPAKNPGNKVCERVVVDYSYPTKNHQVTLRLFTDLAQQCASAMRIASLIKVSSVMHKTVQRAKSVVDTYKGAKSGRSNPSQPDVSGDASATKSKAQLAAADKKTKVLTLDAI